MLSVGAIALLAAFQAQEPDSPAPKFRLEHDREVYAASFSPDGKLIATGERSGAIHLWSAETGMKIRSLEGMADWTQRVLFSPDGKTVAASGKDDAVRLWNASTGERTGALDLLGQQARGLAFSPDGKQLAATDALGYLHVWELATSKELFKVNALPTKYVHTVVFSGDGKFALTAAARGPSVVRAWDLATGKEAGTITGHTDVVSGLMADRNGTLFATCSWDRTVRLWELSTASGFSAKEVRSMTSPRQMQTLALSPDGTLVAARLSDGSVTLWEASSGKELVTYPKLTSTGDLVFSPDGKLLAGSTKKSLSVYDLRTWKAPPGK